MTSQESEVHKRALTLIEDPFEVVYKDVEVRSFRTHEIEIIEAKMGDEEHSLTIYAAGPEGEVSLLAYKWDNVKGAVTVKSNPTRLQTVLEVLRKHQVLDDLASI